MPPKKSTGTTSATVQSKPSNELHTIVFASKGDIKKAKIPLNDGKLELSTIQSYLKKKTEPVQLGKYTHEGITLFLYGYKEGKAGTENKYEFAPPYESLLPFGDVLLIASLTKNVEYPMQYTEMQWTTFYEQAMGGFELLDSEVDSVDGSSVVSDEEIDAIPSDVEDGEEEVIIDEPEEEEDELPVKPAPKKKKSSAVVSTFYQKQMTLMSSVGFNELSPDDMNNSKIPFRQRAAGFLAFLTEIGFPTTAANELERGIYLATCEEADRRNVVKHWDNTLFNGLYQSNFRTVCTHLHPKSPIRNERLIERIRAGEITFENLPSLSPQEMFPENWKELADRQAIREQKLLEGNKGMATDRYKCGRCGKRECSYYEMQTRSADEPMTIFISCLNCGKRWRQ